MSTHSTWCRLSECLTGLEASVDGGDVRSIAEDPAHPLGRGGACGICRGSTGARRDPRRLLQPRRRRGDRWEDVGWEPALREITAELKAIRHRHGVDSVGLYAGPPVALDTRSLVRTLAWPLATGGSRLYSPLASMGGPWLRAVELVMGTALPLQGDIGRAHYVLLLGANQEAQGWGPLQGGRSYTEELAHSRRTKGTKLIAADPRRTSLAAGADLHLALRPGSELYLLLGMIRAILDNGWHETQYVRDWCGGESALRAALTPWTTERCAELCGVTTGDIGGVALKFSRAAMAVVARSPQALQSAHGTLTAWAMLVLHALTANLLRPGGLYDNQGLFDAAAVATALRSDRAPHTRSGDYPLLLLQSPGTILPADVHHAEAPLRALITVEADPAANEAGASAQRGALAALDLLVALDLAETATTRLAHWVLPTTHAWERSDLHYADTPVLPWRTAQSTPALVEPPGSTRHPADILAALFRGFGPALRGSRFGPALRVQGGRLITADIEPWAARQLSGRHFPGSVADLPRGWDGGDVDRATWRPAGGKLELLPPLIATTLASHQPQTLSPPFDRWLLTSAARDGAIRRFDRPPGADPGVTLATSSGFQEGQRVRVSTRAGAVYARVHLDAHLRPDTVDLPAGYETDVPALIPLDALDPCTGTPMWNGLPCRVEAT